MELGDLIRDEQLALVALVMWVIEVNGRATEEETAVVDLLADELGVQTYRELARAVDERLPDRRSLRAFFETIYRQEARELIYGTALKVAAGDLINDDESRFLDWLRQTWQLRVQVEPPAT